MFFSEIALGDGPKKFKDKDLVYSEALRYRIGFHVFRNFILKISIITAGIKSKASVA